METSSSRIAYGTGSGASRRRLATASIVGVGSMWGQWSQLAKEGIVELSNSNEDLGYGNISKQAGQYHQQLKKVVRQ